MYIFLLKLESEDNPRVVPNKSVILPSPWVYRSPCAPVCAPFAFCVRSPFTVHSRWTQFRSAFAHRLLTMRSVFAYRSFRVRSPFTHRSCGEVESFRDCICDCWNMTYIFIIHIPIMLNQMIWYFIIKYCINFL